MARRDTVLRKPKDARGTLLRLLRFLRRAGLGSCSATRQWPAADSIAFAARTPSPWSLLQPCDASTVET